MPRKRDNGTERARQVLAQEAARIIVNHGVRDYRVAKQKAAERLGVNGRGALPGNAEIEAAVAEHLHHLHDLVITGLIDVPGLVGVGEADRALHVAAVGEVQIGQCGVAKVQVAETTIVRAHLGMRDERVLHAHSVVGKLL